MDASELLEHYAAGEIDFPSIELFDSDEDFICDDEGEIQFYEPIIRKSPVNLKNADLTGINLSRAKICDAELEGVNLSNANLRGANLSGANLWSANLSHADLSCANLSNVEQTEDELDICAPMKELPESEQTFINLSYAKLSKANLTNADLTGADLTGADLSNVDLTNTILEDVKLKFANLCNANLSGLDLSHLDLTNAKLVEADLTFTDLSFTIFTGADLTGADLSEANINGTIFGAQKPSEELEKKNQELEELRQKNQELVESVKSLEIQVSGVSIEDWLKPLGALQSDFIKRLKSNQLLFSPLSSSNEGLHKESIIVSGEKRRTIRNFCWDMVKKFNRSDPRNSFRNSLKGKLGEEGIRSCLGDLVAPVDYNVFPGGDGGVDLRVHNFPDIGIQVKTTYNTIEKACWKISEKEKELNKVLACVLILEEIEDDQPEFNLLLAGFLPTFKITRNEVKMNELLYIGGLQGYLDLIMPCDTSF